jgi:hypothetical protein
MKFHMTFDSVNQTLARFNLIMDRNRMLVFVVKRMWKETGPWERVGAWVPVGKTEWAYIRRR